MKLILNFYKKIITISFAVCLIAFTFFSFKKINYGEEFSKGIFFEFVKNDKIKILKEIENIKEIQNIHLEQNKLNSDIIKIKIHTKKNTNTKIIKEKIEKILKENKLNIKNINYTEDSMKQATIRSSALSTLLALSFIAIYISLRFNLKFAIIALYSIIFNLILTLFFSILINIEINSIIIIALLTIIGYCINDSVILLDKIKQVYLLNKNENTSRIVEKSMNFIFNRAIFTSLTTLIANLSLMIIKNEQIRAFSITFSMGILTGLISSLIIIPCLIIYFNKDLNSLEEKEIDLKTLNT